MRARIAISLAVAVLTAGLAGGCGTSDESQVRDTLAALARATAHKDYKTLCRKVFARVLVQRVTSIGLPCERAMGIGLGNVRRPRLTVLSVKVEGGQADARVRSSARGERSSVDTVHLIKEDGHWRVSSLITPQAPH